MSTRLHKINIAILGTVLSLAAGFGAFCLHIAILNNPFWFIAAVLFFVAPTYFLEYPLASVALKDRPLFTYWMRLNMLSCRYSYRHNGDMSGYASVCLHAAMILDAAAVLYMIVGTWYWLFNILLPIF